jgi:hypothetical protein
MNCDRAQLALSARMDGEYVGGRRGIDVDSHVEVVRCQAFVRVGGTAVDPTADPVRWSTASSLAEQSLPRQAATSPGHPTAAPRNARGRGARRGAVIRA